MNGWLGVLLVVLAILGLIWLFSLLTGILFYGLIAVVVVALIAAVVRAASSDKPVSLQTPGRISERKVQKSAARDLRRLQRDLKPSPKDRRDRR